MIHLRGSGRVIAYAERKFQEQRQEQLQIPPLRCGMTPPGGSALQVAVRMGKRSGECGVRESPCMENFAGFFAGKTLRRSILDWPAAKRRVGWEQKRES